MTTILIACDIHNPARPPRHVTKSFEIDRDLETDPIEVNEVLHLGSDFLSADVLVIGVEGGDPPCFRRELYAIDPSASEDAKVNEAATLGWTVVR